MKYYNTELWNVFNNYNLTEFYMANELNINSHNFINNYGNDETKLYKKFICKNCKQMFIEFAANSSNLTCNEYIIKELLE